MFVYYLCANLSLFQFSIFHFLKLCSYICSLSSFLLQIYDRYFYCYTNICILEHLYYTQPVARRYQNQIFSFSGPRYVFLSCFNLHILRFFSFLTLVTSMYFYILTIIVYYSIIPFLSVLPNLFQYRSQSPFYLRYSCQTLDNSMNLYPRHPKIIQNQDNCQKC